MGRNRRNNNRVRGRINQNYSGNPRPRYGTDVYKKRPRSRAFKHVISGEQLKPHAYWSKMKIFDIGFNLMNSQFRGKYKGVDVHKMDNENVLNRAKAYGVVRILITPSDFNQCFKSYQKCERY
jgi:hypothetical protein